MRCAAAAQVGESVALPLKYYNNNLVATLNLLESMGRHGCKKARKAPTASVCFLGRARPKPRTSRCARRCMCTCFVISR